MKIRRIRHCSEALYVFGYCLRWYTPWNRRSLFDYLNTRNRDLHFYYLKDVQFFFDTQIESFKDSSSLDFVRELLSSEDPDNIVIAANILYNLYLENNG